MGYKKVGDGTLGLNYQRTRPDQPDYTGKIVFEGRRLNIAVWEKRNGESGQKFWSFAITEGQSDSTQSPEPRRPAPRVSEDYPEMEDDDMPF